MSVICAWSCHEPITEEWLSAIGFKWHEVERSPRHWLLWLHVDGMLITDLGVELCANYPNHDDTFYFCWLRGDYSHRYSRFIHVRHLKLKCELLRLIEGLTGLDWNPNNAWYGSLVSDKQSAYFTKERERLDVHHVERSPKWNELEEDGTRGYPLSEHQELLRRRGDKG